LASDQGNGKRAVVLPISEVRRIVERVCARQDVFDACAKRDLGYVIGILNANGLTQEQIASLTGLHQNRLSNYKTGKHEPKGNLGLRGLRRRTGPAASGPAGTGT
jgi:Helix-turn-helix